VQRSKLCSIRLPHQQRPALIWAHTTLAVNTKTTLIYRRTPNLRYFFAKAMHAKTNKGKPEIIDAHMLQAVLIAEKIAPYRRARLSAVKLAGDPNNPARFKDDATADELRAELMKRIAILQDAGLIDLKALPPPHGGTANQPIPGVDRSGINGE
jgi:hypothetical protein